MAKNPCEPAWRAHLPSRILTELLAQHATLRDSMSRCEQLADELDAGHIEPAAAFEEVTRLRVAFETHNRYEEQFLRPVLDEGDAFAAVRIDRMVADHVEEHRLVHAELGNAVTGELRRTVDRLRRHLDAEERYFLTSQVLRDDLVVVEGGG